MKKYSLAVGVFLTMILLIPFQAHADKPVGQIAKVKNSVHVIRNHNKTPAKPLMSLTIQDVITTGTNSRAKLTFTDQSVLNLGESSELEVKEYQYHELRKRSKSVYELINGTLKTVVGRSDLKIHTTTAVCAARGTEFILWIEQDGGSALTGLIMIEGETTIRNINKNIPETVTVRAGEMTRVYADHPPEKVRPADMKLMKSITKVIGTNRNSAPTGKGSSITGTVTNQSDIDSSTNMAVGQDSEANIGSVIMK